MLLAQVASEVAQLSRKMDAFLVAQRREPHPAVDVQSSSKSSSKASREESMPRGLLISYRSFIRKTLCKNPTSEVKGSYRKVQKLRARFFDTAVIDGGTLALEFFKSMDLANAATMFRENTPPNGVSSVEIMNALK